MAVLEVTFDLRRAKALVLALVCLGATGCAGTDYTSALKPDFSWWSRSSPALQPVTASIPTQAPPDQLVGPNGACPEGVQPRGIAIGMTECELVRTAGPTQNIQLGQNERGERTATIVYQQGTAAGSYQFRSGILISVEAVAPPPATAKPARKPRAKPKPAAKPPGAPA
ncbi:hypothetical protein GJW-30_1_03505 [Variibacter gotjawalensis]|uniref:Uncharacterized protein n=1 Tax=Variibacter gotjawalensis TaxID=1333996 RepID=A0A0S3PYI0_9BRAD|nr:hypothetical protein [Variibacter gotjawalensis]NIK46792.1 hypothetical protein [Variibacter gotjawalensis]RZS48696.1 hypothetical protein EV661_1111 [Variibacter gotjawalensis]BAT60955.1 hypothetical protein GJW-30_1_03505 [Variibacter gotjawalensis]